ncbi:MAG: class I SAM-dependent DNA methyltransferase, partial [Candidatus Omnitrophota bacterium]|nr:class I SAM-dependent DNA methyltransferase [Candidatus Omnitrophota bacterium]
LDRARTTQRNFIARYLKDRGEKDAGLIAFVSPDEEDWRFSLVKMDYRFEEGKNGKVKIKEEFTPARRWSFLVGKNENSHTAQSKLYPIIANDEHNPTLAELEYAFNIEKVTKEFFEKYRDLFLRNKETLDEVVAGDASIKADFEAKGVNTVDFAKKLLGQIVFLYFLQKKGWFGVARDADWGTGSKRFLRELFEGRHGAYNNFFNDILESLFYDALRNDRGHDDGYYSRFNCKIPFLNGGLFDPINNYDWVRTDIILPNELFSNNLKTKEGDTGNGILDIFDRYNFTVKEDEPLEKEVAVDPEMLGKVFENLLEVKDRKSKGTYYTPREIVHYMCQQSLINYLATELSDCHSRSPLSGNPESFFKGTGFRLT